MVGGDSYNGQPTLTKLKRSTLTRLDSYYRTCSAVQRGELLLVHLRKAKASNDGRRIDSQESGFGTCRSICSDTGTKTSNLHDVLQRRSSRSEERQSSLFPLNRCPLHAPARGQHMVYRKKCDDSYA